jgi:predicted anti-sigma-YlaC factor YlaD
MATVTATRSGCCYSVAILVAATVAMLESLLAISIAAAVAMVAAAAAAVRMKRWQAQQH